MKTKIIEKLKETINKYYGNYEATFPSYDLELLANAVMEVIENDRKN